MFWLDWRKNAGNLYLFEIGSLHGMISRNIWLGIWKKKQQTKCCLHQNVKVQYCVMKEADVSIFVMKQKCKECEYVSFMKEVFWLWCD